MDTNSESQNTPSAPVIPALTPEIEEFDLAGVDNDEDGDALDKLDPESVVEAAELLLHSFLCTEYTG